MPIDLPLLPAWLLHLGSLLCLLAAAGGGVLGWRDWRRVGGWPGGSEEVAVGRTRLMGVLHSKYRRLAPAWRMSSFRSLQVRLVVTKRRYRKLDRRGPVPSLTIRP